uniref:Chloride channel protein n=1 Tax=Eutreptiella gymnastica TaxID=73025 RepID=A0A7S1J315_9EUGL|mmetsp:Transcript_61702/g.109905  ORF Transcript_61702/g.109905 Transcript_61702/m.109905 type:complete len:839 (+) Transcript_61702:118-2634(+)
MRSVRGRPGASNSTTSSMVSMEEMSARGSPPSDEDFVVDPSIGNPKWSRIHNQGARFPSIFSKSNDEHTVHTPMQDFATIDWVGDQELSQRRTEQLHEGTGAWRTDCWLLAWDQSQGWIAVALIGVITGIIAWAIDTSVQWITDLKHGYCYGRPWLSYEVCCRHFQDEGRCPEFTTWADYFLVHGSGPREAMAYGSYVLVAVVLAMTSAWLCRTFARYAAGSGIPEIKTILGGTHINRFLSNWTLLIKAVGLSLSVGSGLSLGKEGPYVHVASCVGNMVSRWFHKFRLHENKKRELLSASTAAGVSVAFGAPIGGVLFSLEEASYFFPHKVMWRTLFCAIVAALTLQTMDPHGNGKIVMFQVDHHHVWKWFELVPFLFIGVLGGVIGGIFITLNLKWCRYRRNSSMKDWPIMEAAVVAGLTAIFQFPNPYMRGGMGSMLSRMFQDCKPGSTDTICVRNMVIYTHLLIAGVLKIALTIFTFGMKVPSGLFVPSLYMGACFGRVVGMVMQDFYVANPDWTVFHECHHNPTECVVPGVYAIVGAASVLSGVTHMTISLVVIMFELTGGLELVLPVLVVVLMSKWVSELIGGRESIYERHIELNQYPFLDPKLEVTYPARSRAVIDGQQLQVLTERGFRISEVQSLLEKYPYSGFPVVNDGQNLLVIGYISRKCIGWALQKGFVEHTDELGPGTEVVFGSGQREASERESTKDLANQGGQDMIMDISEYMDPAPIQVDARTSINRVLHLFKSLGLRYLLVSQGGKLQGIITRKDLLSFLQKPRHLQSPTFAEGSIQGSTEGSDDDDQMAFTERKKPAAMVRVRSSLRAKQKGKAHGPRAHAI